MILRYYGHSLFTLALECGVTLLTDPYGDFFDYPRQRLQADIVTISHHHHDHDAISMVAGNAVVLDQPGNYTPAPGLRVTGIPGWHDTQNGAQRGNNLMFVIETEGLRIVHMGDIGHRLTERQCLQLGTQRTLPINTAHKVHAVMPLAVGHKGFVRCGPGQTHTGIGQSVFQG